MFFNNELFANLLMLLSLAAIYLGFAGFLGSLLFQFRSRLHWTLQGLVLLLTLLAFAGIAMLPPWTNPLMRGQLLVAFLVVLIFSLRPIGRPDWIWKSALAFRYLSLTLVLVVLWSISDPASERIILAPWAALAALLAWQRSNHKTPEPARSTASAAPQKSTPPAGERVTHGRGEV